MGGIWLGVLLAAVPAWAQTTTTKPHHRAHAVHRTASKEPSGTSMARRHHHTGDDRR
jgi:hypothetical protein